MRMGRNFVQSWEELSLDIGVATFAATILSVLSLHPNICELIFGVGLPPHARRMHIAQCQLPESQDPRLDHLGLYI